MKPCPKSKFEDANGCMNFMSYDKESEYPEVLAWELEYRNICDQLATTSASKHKRHWGRWYLDSRKPFSLNTDSLSPSIGTDDTLEGGTYDIELSRVDTSFGEKHNGYSWIKHMSEKNWIGHHGLKDLESAFTQLIKEGLIK